jgi:PTS system nitrogen regulatory IIA component
MNITNLLKPDCILVDVTASNKRELLEKIAEQGAICSGLHQKEIFDALLQRERLGTTGTGDGVAIPHSRFPNLKQIYGVFVRLSQPVDFEAVDEKPVDLIFTLLAPETAGADHLHALSQVAKVFKDEGAKIQLRASKTTSAIQTIFADVLNRANAA